MFSEISTGQRGRQPNHSAGSASVVVSDQVHSYLGSPGLMSLAPLRLFAQPDSCKLGTDFTDYF